MDEYQSEGSYGDLSEQDNKRNQASPESEGANKRKKLEGRQAQVKAWTILNLWKDTDLIQKSILRNAQGLLLSGQMYDKVPQGTACCTDILILRLDSNGPQ